MQVPHVKAALNASFRNSVPSKKKAKSARVFSLYSCLDAHNGACSPPIRLPISLDKAYSTWLAPSLPRSRSLFYHPTPEHPHVTWNLVLGNRISSSQSPSSRSPLLLPDSTSLLSLPMIPSTPQGLPHHLLLRRSSASSHCSRLRGLLDSLEYE